MSAHWMLGVEAIRHVARALGVSRYLARKELMMAAAEGSVVAADRERSPVPIDPKAWLPWSRAGYAARLARIYFRRTDIEAVFPLPGAAKAEAPTPRTPAKRGGGAPVQYDWEAMIAELVRWADKEGLPKSQRAAGKYLADWYAAKNGGEGPHKNTVRKRLGRYLAHLPEGDDN